MSDYSLAFEYLAYSYLYANSLIKNHPKISEMNKELTLFLGKISIDFDPSEINNVPAFVDNNRGATVSALYGSTPLDNFQLKAYFDRGMGEWKNNTEVFPTDSDGKSFLKIGKIISKSENQKILIIPDVKKIEDSRITEISYKKLDEKLRQSQSSGLSIKVRDKPSLAFKYKYKNKLGIENIIDNNLPNLLEEEFRPKFNSGDCSSSSDECIDVLVEISLKNQNKKSNMYNIGLDMFVDQKNIKEKYSSIVISINGDNNSSFFKDNNKKKIQESMNSLYNELFLATISYNLNPNVELVINKSKYTGKGQQKVDKGLVTFNFAYKNDKSNSNIFLHETELVVSSSIDLDDNFKAFTKFSPKDINYHFFITNSRDDNWNWNDVTIQWDGGDIQSWDEKQKIFEQCPDFSCRGNIIKSHELHIKKNGYLPGIFSVNVERLRAYKEIPNVKLEKLYDKARPIHHLLPGYSQRKYFQTNKMGRARGWGYHMVWAVSLAYIYKSFNEYTSANTEFNQISARYSGYGPDTPQQAFNDDWNLMEYNRNQYLGSRSNFSFGIALLATLYGLNSFEILTYQAR